VRRLPLGAGDGIVATASLVLGVAILPILMVLLLPASALMWGVSGSSLVFLALLGLLAARAGRIDDRVRHARRLLGRVGNGIDSRSRRAVRGRRLRSTGKHRSDTEPSSANTRGAFRSSNNRSSRNCGE